MLAAAARLASRAARSAAAAPTLAARAVASAAAAGASDAPIDVELLRPFVMHRADAPSQTVSARASPFAAPQAGPRP